MKLADLFPNGRVKTAEEYKLVKKPDKDVVRVAGDKALIIVTNNTRDYTQEMRRVVKTGNRRRHLFGLVTLGASSYEKQCDLFPFDNFAHRMSLGRLRNVSWELVGIANLWVHVRAPRDIEVTRLPPCHASIKRGDNSTTIS